MAIKWTNPQDARVEKKRIFKMPPDWRCRQDEGEESTRAARAGQRTARRARWAGNFLSPIFGTRRRSTKAAQSTAGPLNGFCNCSTEFVRNERWTVLFCFELVANWRRRNITRSLSGYFIIKLHHICKIYNLFNNTWETFVISAFICTFSRIQNSRNQFKEIRHFWEWLRR